ncbi:hypothetical protein TcasGA2_TC003590 [Tribolium castaneum]|uniref:Uncharacterized protein n=1 Tax=Tribolium castaneum TaxID=7070 RepID=D6WHY1_TRICA|nr:PREDICTED: uncharacterized protein LOC103312594 [Tribolium castaneum]EFA00711.1 hypothetical protein TcasGA2_TC003590 [Tribolium castaneum]|eukprot:XP_008191827.1 PREDICTED: uncharacterized protein LOC103312594 [Tribolium castaneum]
MRPVLVLVMIFSVSYARYLEPYNYGYPRPLVDFLNRLSLSDKIKRCGNTFDESCANLPIIGASSDESWLAHSSPGKRCANVWGESCINGGIIGGGSDQSWLQGDDNPGRR